MEVFMGTFLLVFFFGVVCTIHSLLLYFTKDIRKYKKLVRISSDLLKESADLKLYRDLNRDRIYFDLFGVRFYQQAALKALFDDVNNLKERGIAVITSYYRNGRNVSNEIINEGTFKEYSHKFCAW